MAGTFRAITADELPELLDLDRIGFGQEERKPEQPDSWSAAELDRTRCAWDGGQMVSAGRNYTFELTLPGGALLPAAAVSWVSVSPTHRRRGYLTGLIDALHTDARERGEPVSILTASESLIYGRFGYGVCTWRLGFSVERAHAKFARPDDDDGRVYFVDDSAETVKLFASVYEAARRARHGMVSRPDYWWPEVMYYFTLDHSPTFRVVHEDRDGTPDAFAAYSIKGDWGTGLSEKTLHVYDIQSSNDRARGALWRFLVGVDLIHTISAMSQPVDEPFRFMLADLRRARVDYINDGMWLCIHDEAATLAARTYSADDGLVLEVHRPDGTKESFEVEGNADGATCRATRKSPDISLGTSQLGSVYLGGVSFRELMAAGLIDELSTGAIARADDMFSTRPLPAMTSGF
jgi:predicted acetyltransferase